MSNGEPGESLPIGEKIKRLRDGANLSVEELAERAGLDTSQLEEIEQDMISPALGTLTKICAGLGVRLGSFFDQGPRKLYSIVRAGDEKVATRFASKSGTDHGYTYQALGAEKRERVMEPFIITIYPPNDPSGKSVQLESLNSHNGEEFIYVLEGEIKIQLEDQVFIMSPGDSIYYDGSVPHRVIHHGKNPCKTLTVIHLPRK